MNPADLKEVEKIVREFFEKMTFLIEIENNNLQDSALELNLAMEEPQILIGERGQTLLEIQHLLRAILSRKFKEPVYLDLDINDYKKRKIQYIRELTREAIEEVALTKKEKVLPPMPAYERRIIHLETAGRQDITSESIGEGPDRRVAIKPILNIKEP